MFSLHIYISNYNHNSVFFLLFSVPFCKRKCLWQCDHWDPSGLSRHSSRSSSTYYDSARHVRQIPAKNRAIDR